MNDETRFPHDMNSPREIGDHQHVNSDGQTDAEKGAMIGGVGGAVTGAVAGAMVGPAGAIVGGVVGAVAGGLGSGAAVAQVDKFDNDNTVSGLGDDPITPERIRPVGVEHPDQRPGLGPDAPGERTFGPAQIDPNRPENRPMNEDQDPMRQHPYEPKNPYAPADPDVDMPVSETGDDGRAIPNDPNRPY